MRKPISFWPECGSFGKVMKAPSLAVRNVSRPSRVNLYFEMTEVRTFSWFEFSSVLEMVLPIELFLN